ncbi:MAG: uracil-DNA glycosylase [Clostridiaceae bacterium]|nr:uracil-DNA glycosylase [Clostridiaceae bacterium]
MKKPEECLKCQYYQVTWDPRHPRGCRFYGFKSTRIPSHVVQESSGEPCKAFKPRVSRKAP